MRIRWRGTELADLSIQTHQLTGLTSSRVIVQLDQRFVHDFVILQTPIAAAPRVPSSG
jgi:hypothetical protein